VLISDHYKNENLSISTKQNKNRLTVNMSLEQISRKLDLVLEQISRKLDEVLQKLDEIPNSSSQSGQKKKATPSKADQYKISTETLLKSTKKLCAYMQKSTDCKGHCGREAIYSVINETAQEIDDVQVEPAKDEKQEQMRKSFYRCPTCKSKGKKPENSRGYKKIRNHLFGQDGTVDTVIDDDLAALVGSPKKPSKPEVDVESGLDDVGQNPEDPNPHLLKTEKWEDKFVKMGKKNIIIRSFFDARKKDVIIGMIQKEPENSDYEKDLEKPGKSILEKVGLKYKIPEEASRETPPKAPKKKEKEESDDDNQEDSDNDEEAEFRRIVESDD
jgi:hypothetical protein